MVRVKFIKYRQNQFLKEIMADTGLNSKQAAKLCNVCTRTFRDWKRGKYQISYTALSRLCKISHIPIPKNIEILPEFWSTKKAGTLGGKRRFELYGPLGSIESRRKGGINSSRQFSLNPEWAKEKGFVVRKEIKHPDKSSLLAEFIGIMIGDGSVRNDHQITISFNGEKDQHHASHIQLMVRILFDISSSKYIRKEKGAADIVVTGKNLIEFLEDLGIRKGNKVVNQINIPGWIFECRAYQIACLRGLFDTDESICPHNYTVGAKRYRYIKMCFSNRSLPVLISVKKILEDLNFHPIIDRRQQLVSLHRPSEVNRYFLEVGTSNSRYYNRYKKFFSEKIGRIGEVV